MSFGTSILLVIAAPLHAERESDRWSNTALAGTDVALELVGWAANDQDGVLASEIEGAGSGVLAAADRIERTFETKLRVHIVDGQLGWQWGIGRGLTLRASLGAQKIVHTTTSLSPSFTPAEPATVARIIDVAERRLADASTGLWAPQGSMYLGYTF